MLTQLTGHRGEPPLVRNKPVKFSAFYGSNMIQVDSVWAFFSNSPDWLYKFEDEFRND